MNFYQVFLETLKRKTAKSEADNPLLAWSKHFLPQYFVKAPSAMHRWLAAQLDDCAEQRGTKINVLAPRGAAKSTLATLAYPLRQAVECREPYIWIVSDTMPQAHSHLENIKAELLDNKELAKHYPSACGRGPVWRNGSIVLNNDVVIEAFGTGQHIRGRRRKEHRPALIICDDLQNDQHIISAAAREKSRSWFHGTLLKAGTTGTNVINLATALHREAIAMELLKNTGWNSKVFKAVDPFPNDMNLWERWEMIYTNIEDIRSKINARLFYEQNKEAMDDGAGILWTEHEPLYELMKMRVESGRTAFEREKQNSPLDPDRCEFPEDLFDDTIWFDTLPKSLILKMLALDPSKGRQDAYGDYSAFVFAALSKDGIIYIDADLAKRPLSEIVSQGVELYKQYQPNVFGMETNQFQELLKNDFDEAFIAAGLPNVAVYPIQNSVNKNVRIRRLGSHLSQRRLRFKRGSASVHLLLDQLKSFPLSDHDDGPDALEMAIRMLNEWILESG